LAILSRSVLVPWPLQPGKNYGYKPCSKPAPLSPFPPPLQSSNLPSSPFSRRGETVIPHRGVDILCIPSWVSPHFFQPDSSPFYSPVSANGLGGNMASLSHLVTGPLYIFRDHPSPPSKETRVFSFLILLFCFSLPFF